MGVDLTRDITYRGFLLNDGAIGTHTTGGHGIATGISGCVVDSMDFSDVDVVQYIEKRSQTDGMDAGDVFLGARRIRLTGTLYGTTRALLYDSLYSLRAAFSPVLAQRESPLDRGYRPLNFTVPTNRIESYPLGVVPLFVNAMPRAFSAMVNRNQIGGDDSNSLAIPWQATLVCKDPSIYGQDIQDFSIPDQVYFGSATATASTDLINQVAHGLVADDRVQMMSLTGGTGLSTGVNYYVLASGLTADAFKVSLTSGGAAVNITVDYSNVRFVKGSSVSGNLTNRGTYLAPVNALWEVSAYSGLITGVIGDSNFVITIPASASTRIIRFKGADKVLTVEESGVEVTMMNLLSFNSATTWPLISPGTSSYIFAVSGAVVGSGAPNSSHFWFYESYA